MVGSLIHSLIAGLVCGFVVSIPVGPVNLTLINYALRKGFWTAFLVGLGAISAESIYAALMLAGHSTLLDNPQVVYGLRMAAVVVMLALGFRSLTVRTEKIEAGAATVKRVEQKWHHPRSFLLGFILTMSNLILVLLWATLVTVLFAREWVTPNALSRAVCVAGVFGGGAVWFTLLAFFVSRAHRRVKPNVLTGLVRACGGVFIVFAVLLAYKLFKF